MFIGSSPYKSQIMENAIDDACFGFGGPTLYMHIEEIFIPRIHKFQRYENGPWEERKQDLESFCVDLQKVGQFPLEISEEGVVLRAYK